VAQTANFRMNTRDLISRQRRSRWVFTQSGAAADALQRPLRSRFRARL